MEAAVWEQKLADHLKSQGLRLTSQRRTIAHVFFETPGHLDIESLYQIVKEQDPKIGQATVYRTLKLLVGSGLASKSRFGGASTRFEVADQDHHDHLICTQCGRIVEFVNNTIEELQEEIALGHGFELVSHKMELYGKCSDCRS